MQPSRFPIKLFHAGLEHLERKCSLEYSLCSLAAWNLKPISNYWKCSPHLALHSSAILPHIFLFEKKAIDSRFFSPPELKRSKPQIFFRFQPRL